MTHSGQGAEDSFYLDPYADPEQEKLLWRQRSKDHDGSAKPLESSSGKVRKAPFRGQRKSERTFVISRSPVQVRPVAPLKKPLIFLRKSGFFLFLPASILADFSGFSVRFASEPDFLRFWRMFWRTQRKTRQRILCLLPGLFYLRSYCDGTFVIHAFRQ